MANTSILAAFERMWQHVVAIVSNKSDLDHTHDYTKLENKPTETIGGDTLTWDGNTDGLDYYEDAGYKVCDAVVSAEQLANGVSVRITDGSNNMELPMTVLFANEYATMYNCVYYTLAFVHQYSDGVPIGVYLYPMGTIELSHNVVVTISGYTGFTKEVLKKEVLPEHLQFGDTMTEIMHETEIVGADEDGVLVAHIDASVFSGNEKHLNIVWDGVEYACDVQYMEGIPFFGNMGILGMTDTGEPFLLQIMIEYGMAMFVVTDTNTHTVSISCEVTKTIDRKYMSGAVILFADSENYLYEDKDTSDTSKRLTKGKLEDIFMSGLTLYVRNAEYIYYPFSNIQLNPYLSYGCMDVTYGQSRITYHTAEYTAT